VRCKPNEKKHERHKLDKHFALLLFHYLTTCFIIETNVDSQGGIIMGTILILGVCVAFLAAIFAAGYEDNPHKN
jgi:hypothetical protein